MKNLDKEQDKSLSKVQLGCNDLLTKINDGVLNKCSTSSKEISSLINYISQVYDFGDERHLRLAKIAFSSHENGSMKKDYMDLLNTELNESLIRQGNPYLMYVLGMLSVIIFFVIIGYISISYKEYYDIGNILFGKVSPQIVIVSFILSSCLGLLFTTKEWFDSKYIKSKFRSNSFILGCVFPLYTSAFGFLMASATILWLDTLKTTIEHIEMLFVVSSGFSTLFWMLFTLLFRDLITYKKVKIWGRNKVSDLSEES